MANVLIWHILVQLAVMKSVLSNWNGAPRGACSYLLPQHAGFPSKPLKTSPYSVTTEKSTYDKGENVSVSLNSTVGREVFMGFILQARNEKNKVIGRFTTDSQKLSPYQLISCQLGVNNTVTHTHNGPKSKVDLIWIPPKDFIGNVTFRATMVKNYLKFWANNEAKIQIVEPKTKPSAIQTKPDAVSLLLELKEMQMEDSIRTTLALTDFSDKIDKLTKKVNKLKNNSQECVCKN